MKVIVFGATGMIGQGVLRECLLDPEVTEVAIVVRKSTGQQDPKLREIVHENFLDFTGVPLEADACFWCLGISSNGMTEADYTRITHDYTIAAAKVMAKPTMTFVFISGAGAEGKAMWARVKKQTEVDLAPLPFKAVYSFRPSVIQPLHGIRSRTKLYNAFYVVLYPVVLAMKLIAPKSVTTTERVGHAMLNIAKRGFDKKILTNADINVAARS
ncbi:MAG TPA: hypothetical protein VGM90_29210 [Kofleriaceae bacterium]|jgi:uncharacterized protein YbjT (DUF2867 family)